MPSESLPTMDFTTLVLSLSQTALMHMGDVHEPEGAPGDPESRNLPLARQTIDLLGILEEKTKGNLTGDEERLIHQVLYDLRFRFVELTKKEKTSSATGVPKERT